MTLFTPEALGSPPHPLGVLRHARLTLLYTPAMLTPLQHASKIQVRRLRAVLIALATAASAGGCLFVGAPTSTVEVVVQREDTSQPIQNAMIEASTSSARGVWGTLYGPPEYSCVYTDEHGKAEVRVTTAPFALTGMSSHISISAPGFRREVCFVQDDDIPGQRVYDGVLKIALTPGKWRWRKEGEPPDRSTFVVERERPRSDPKDRPEYVPAR